MMDKVIQAQFKAEKLVLESCLDFISVPEAGGQCLFIGNVRINNNNKQVKALEYEGYSAMALKEMYRIGEEAMKKWPLCRIAIHHRYGILSIGDTAVIIAVSSKHRLESFEACQFIIDTLKQRVPIWKKEIYEDGNEWLSAHP